MHTLFSGFVLTVTRHRMAAVMCVGLALVVCGCSGGRKPVYPVHGLVRVDGRAPVHAMVTFHPLADGGPAAVLPIGSVDDQGRFTLTSYAAGDGAPEGEYRVTVAWFLSSGKPGDDSPPANYLPGRYARPDTTPLHAVVHKSAVDLDPFQLEAR
jgi:hypothetical protein